MGSEKTEIHKNVPAEWSYFEVLLVGKLQDEKYIPIRLYGVVIQKT
jgi:hypothetical protein